MNTEIVDNLSDAYYESRTDYTLPLITIYNAPADFAGQFVARIHIVEINGTTRPLIYAALADSLDGIRAKLPQGLDRLERSPEDDKHIIESWI